MNENAGLRRENIVSTQIFVGWDLYILNTRPALLRIISASHAVQTYTPGTVLRAAVAVRCYKVCEPKKNMSLLVEALLVRVLVQVSTAQFAFCEIIDFFYKKNAGKTPPHVDLL